MGCISSFFILVNASSWGGPHDHTYLLLSNSHNGLDIAQLISHFHKSSQFSYGSGRWYLCNCFEHGRVRRDALFAYYVTKKGKFIFPKLVLLSIGDVSCLLYLCSIIYHVLHDHCQRLKCHPSKGNSLKAC